MGWDYSHPIFNLYKYYMEKDYYKILGVDKNATEDQLKKAFRKKSIEWHPDKWQDKSESEKKNAEEQFKKVAEAYECLKDPDKRAKYDQFGENWDKMNQGGFGGFDMDFDMSDIMGDFFGRRRNRNQGPIPGESVQMNYGIGINDIFNGLNKDIEIEVNVRCEHCNGTGGDSETCSYCHGTGTISNTQHTPFGIITQQTTCPHCHGRGRIIKKKCSYCNGQGIIKKKRKIHLNIKPFTQNGYQMRFTGMGYESKDPNGLNGDLLINIVYNIDTSKYVIQGNNVYEKLKIPYYDCILGCTKKVKLPNNKEREITIKQFTTNGDQVSLFGEGLNGGQYIFIIEPELPKRSLNSKINDKEKELLEKIRKIHS